MLLPEEFVKQTTALLGEEADRLFSALEGVPPVSIRINPAKPFGAVREEPVPWSSFGKFLDERPAFTFDPLLHAGCFYVQEASSMFLEQALLRVMEALDNEPVRMLDLCAAPGGKSTLAASVLPEGSLLVANELIRTRANILAENLIKWGYPDVIVTQSDSSSFSKLASFFEVILTDVPCSGEGMFRKDPDSMAEWSPDNVRLCASRQRTILSNCWTALKPGGFLIYSTCTYNTAEDEENVRWICEELGASLVDIPVKEAWGVSGAQGPFASERNFPVYRFLPHKTKGEGFFLALLQKGEVEEAALSVKKNRSKGTGNQKKQPAIPEYIQTYLQNAGDYTFYLDRRERICAMKKGAMADLRLLEEHLRMVHAGIVIGEVKGKDLLPDISLALSVALNRDAVKSVSLGRKDAIRYLRGEAFVLPENSPLGWVLVMFEDHPLGWMKNIGNRANNAYPNEWRIRAENPFPISQQ